MTTADGTVTGEIAPHRPYEDRKIACLQPACLQLARLHQSLEPPSTGVKPSVASNGAFFDVPFMAARRGGS